LFLELHGGLLIRVVSASFCSYPGGSLQYNILYLEPNLIAKNEKCLRPSMTVYKTFQQNNPF
jgi:hypothetical protein